MLCHAYTLVAKRKRQCGRQLRLFRKRSFLGQVILLVHSNDDSALLVKARRNLNREIKEPTNSGTLHYMAAPEGHKPPTAFVSYSWDSMDHTSWVTEFAATLRSFGVETILDRWHLAPGHDKYYFMERGVTDSTFVLVICTPAYAKKANARTGGVGIEATIITPELAGNVAQTKFVPILRIGDWETALPVWIRSRIGFDFRQDFDRTTYRNLVRHLHGASEAPPPVAPRPDFSAFEPSMEPAQATRQLLAALGEVEEYLRTGLMHQVQTSESFGGEDMKPVHVAADVLVRTRPFVQDELARSAKLTLLALQRELNTFLDVLRQAIEASGEERQAAERTVIAQQRHAFETFREAVSLLKRNDAAP